MRAYLIILPKFILGFRVQKNPRANFSSDQRKSHSFVGLHFKKIISHTLPGSSFSSFHSPPAGSFSSLNLLPPSFLPPPPRSFLSLFRDFHPRFVILQHGR